MEEIAKIAKYLTEQKLTLSIAESCTGGLISSYFTDVAGASNYINKNFVTYSNESKTELLKVDPKIIEVYGVISEQVARDMAFGLINYQNSDYAISTTGILGPDDIIFKNTILPKGLVFIGLGLKDKIKVVKYISKKETRIDIKKDITETAIREFENFMLSK